MISYARLNFSVPNVDVTKESLDLGVYCGLFHITLPLSYPGNHGWRGPSVVW